MSWGFEFVANTREEAVRGIDAHKQIPADLRAVMKAAIPPAGFGEGISMIVKSHGHIDGLRGPSNFTFELLPVNNTDNLFYRRAEGAAK